MNAEAIVVIRGGGDLSTGIAMRLHRSGFDVLVTEIEQPLAVRRLVSLAQAVFDGSVHVEDLEGRMVSGVDEIRQAFRDRVIPVLIDPELKILQDIQPLALVDARMRKKPPKEGLELADFIIGLGPGFTAGVDCHVVIETNRGHMLGRVIRAGSAQADTGVPGTIGGLTAERVLRAPVDGVLKARKQLGDLVQKGEVIAEVAGQPVCAPFDGALRGLIHDGLAVRAGLKVGDVDPRGEALYCALISEKALAIAGGVLEALLSEADIRLALGGVRAA